MRLPLYSVNQRLPSGPAVIGTEQLPAVGNGNSVIVPAGVIRPILLAPPSVNHRLSSGPTAIPGASPVAVVGKSVIVPAGVMRPICRGPVLGEPDVAVRPRHDAERLGGRGLNRISRDHRDAGGAARARATAATAASGAGTSVTAGPTAATRDAAAVSGCTTVAVASCSRGARSRGTSSRRASALASSSAAAGTRAGRSRVAGPAIGEGSEIALVAATDQQHQHGRGSERDSSIHDVLDRQSCHHHHGLMRPILLPASVNQMLVGPTVMP